MTRETVGWLCFYAALLLNFRFQIRAMKTRRKIEREAERAEGRGPYSWPKPRVAVSISPPLEDKIALLIAALLLAITGVLIFLG